MVVNEHRIYSAEADAAVAKALGSAPAAEFVNVNKWYAEVNK